MFGMGEDRGHGSKPAKRRKRFSSPSNEPQASSTSTNNDGYGICDYSALDHVIASRPLRWHTVSCIYVTSLFTIGLLAIITIFRGGRRTSNAARGGSIRRKQQKRTLAEHIRDGNRSGGKQATRSNLRTTDAASASSGRVSMLTDDDELERLAEEEDFDSPTASSTSSVEPLQLQDVPLFPREATEAEVARFVRARKGDLTAGAEQLRHYLHWHKLHESAAGYGADSTRMADESLSQYDWRVASSVAQVMEGDLQVENTVPLPCVVFLNNEATSIRSLDGTRICQHLPARITHLASGQVYAQALAIYLDRRLSRQREEKFDVFIDTRPGEGWGNISAYHLVPFIRHASKLLNDLQPERLQKAVVFPVPSVCAFIWNRMIKPWMDPVTADKIVLVGGSARMDSKLPKSMQKIASEEALAHLERRRIALFIGES